MKRITAFMFCLCLLCAVRVYGAELDGILVEQTNLLSRKVTVTGTLKDSLTDSMVSVMVFDGTMTELNGTAIAIEPYLRGIGETVSEKKAFSLPVSLKNSAPTGTYACFVSGENMDTVRVLFSYIKPEDVSAALANLNSADTSNIVTRLNSALTLMGIDSSALSAPGYDTASFYNRFLASRPALGITTPEELEKIFNACLGLQTLSELTDSAAKDAYIIQNATTLMVSVDQYKNYASTVREYTCGKMARENTLSPGALQKFLNEGALLYGFELATVWNTYQELVQSNSDSFPLTAEQQNWYDNVTNKDEIFKKMYQNKPSVFTLENLRSAYISAIQTQYSTEQAVIGTNNIPSGGGGGGAGVSVSFSGNSNADVSSGAVQSSQAGAVFTDIDSVPWAEEAILGLAKKGVLSGVDEQHFCPNDMITREAFAKLIVVAFELTDYEATLNFSDVQAGAWYEPYIQSAVGAGVVQGIDAERFGVGEKITRQDLATMAYRAAIRAGISLSAMQTADFTDADAIAEYAKEAVIGLTQAGIINGMSDGEFAPKEFATRAQAAKIVYHLSLTIAE